jgi:hypothetical protein
LTVYVNVLVRTTQGWAALAPVVAILIGCGGHDDRSNTASPAATRSPATVRHCLANAGLRVMGGARAPDDEDAPDVELIVSSRRDLVAFVAFYREAGRAERYEKPIRKNAADFGGSVDRLGKVTLVWPPDPEPKLRAQVQHCVSR